MNNKETNKFTEGKKEIQKVILISGISGAFGGAFMIGFITLLFKQAPGSSIQEIATVDTHRIIKERASTLAKQNYALEDIQRDQLTFVQYLDDAMNVLSEEKHAVLLKPESTATFRLPDYTEEVLRRIKLQESRGRKNTH